MTKVPISASTPTGADRPAAAPEPALDDERLDEGFLQLDLGFRWTRYLLGYLPSPLNVLSCTYFPRF